MEGPLIKQSMDLAVAVISMCDNIHNRGPLKNQLLRAACSIGANIHEAQYGYSKDDFIFKLQTALKECNETHYWLQLFVRSGTVTASDTDSLIGMCNRIRFMLIKSLNTAKSSDQSTRKQGL